MRVRQGRIAGTTGTMDGTWAPPRPPKPRRGPGRVVFWVITGVAAACLIGSLTAVLVTTHVYRQTSVAMEPAIQVGDRVAVSAGAGFRRGDIVVLHIPANFAGAGELVVKRIIGLPGDHVVCCNADGRVTVNGKPLDETYLYPGQQPSTVTFSVTLGKGQLWVMGDNRSYSEDSREWGPIPASDVVGPVLVVLHGASMSSVRTPQTFVADGLAPPDSRTPRFAWLLAIGGVAFLILVVQLIVGVTRTILRRRRASRTPSPV